MTEHSHRVEESHLSTGDGATPAREDLAIDSDAAGRGHTEHPAANAFPDLSRLSLNAEGPGPAERVGERRGRDTSSLGVVLPGMNVHLSVNAHNSPVTINVFPAAQPPPASGEETRRTPRVVRMPAGVIPAAAPARIRLGATPATGHFVPAGNQVGATVATHAPAPAGVPGGAPLSPLQQGFKAESRPPSPRLESAPPSAPGSPAPELAALPAAQVYEHIAERDPTHTRWYVVTAGRRVGIWREWVDMSDYVNRVPGNQHKLFNSRAEAEQHYYGNKALGNVQVIMP